MMLFVTSLPPLSKAQKSLVSAWPSCCLHMFAS